MAASDRVLGAGARRRQDVQGLRAIAVLYVVVFHAGLPWDGGFTGVDVFFVISGFVITGVLAREQHATGRLDLWRFYSRRVKRLLPALAVMLVAVSILGVVAAPVGGVTNGTGTGIFAALFSANLYVYRLSTGYFDLDSELNPLLHTWTLGVEEQFYVGFSLLLLASWALARRRGGDGRAIVLGAVAAVTVGSFAVALAAPEKLAFYGSPARAWEFGVGALIALLAVWIRRLPARAAAALGVLGAAALALTGPLVGEGGGTPAVSVLLPVAGTCALLAAGTSAATVTTRLLSWSPLVWIGDVSYSWYLWHWPLIVFATALWPSDGSGPAAVAAAVSLLPAWLSYRYVENPIRFNPRIQGRRVLALAATCVVVPIVACGGWRAVNSYMTNHLDTLVAVHDSRRLTAGEVRGCRGAYAPLPARPACTWTVPDSRGTAVLVGDSVAATLTEPFVAAANRDGLDATVTSVHGCPFADLRIHGYFPQLEPICSARYRESMAALTRARPSLVVIGATSNYLWDPVISLGPATSRRVTNRTAEKQRLWAESLTGTIGRLNAAGIPVLVVQPTPEARELPSACAVLRVLTKDCRRARPRADVERELRPMIAAERQAVRGAQAATFDPVPVLCGTASCPATRGSAILFRDRQHLSIAGARLLTDGLAEAIGRLVRPA